MKISNIIVISMVFMLTGCVKENMIKTYTPLDDMKIKYHIDLKQSDIIPNKALKIMHAQLRENLQNNNRLAEETDQRYHDVTIIVENYRARHGALRALAGIMAGCDSIISNVKIYNQKHSQILGEASFESKNCRRMGSTQNLIKEHMDKIAGFISG